MAQLKQYTPPTARDVLAIWRGTAVSDLPAKRAGLVLEMKDRIERGEYGPDDPRVATAFGRLADTLDGSAAVEAERAAWDQGNDGERFE